MWEWIARLFGSKTKDQDLFEVEGDVLDAGLETTRSGTGVYKFAIIDKSGQIWGGLDYSFRENNPRSGTTVKVVFRHTYKHRPVPDGWCKHPKTKKNVPVKYHEVEKIRSRKDNMVLP